MKKGEIALFEQFHLFRQCFPKALFFNVLKWVHMEERVNLSPYCNVSALDAHFVHTYLSKYIQIMWKFVYTREAIPLQNQIETSKMKPNKDKLMVVTSISFSCPNNFFKNLLFQVYENLWLYGKGFNVILLTLSKTSPGFYVSAVQVFWKHCGKRKNCL